VLGAPCHLAWHHAPPRCCWPDTWLHVAAPCHPSCTRLFCLCTQHIHLPAPHCVRAHVVLHWVDLLSVTAWTCRPPHPSTSTHAHNNHTTRLSYRVCTRVVIVNRKAQGHQGWGHVSLDMAPVPPTSIISWLSRPRPLISLLHPAISRRCTPCEAILASLSSFRSWVIDSPRSTRELPLSRAPRACQSYCCMRLSTASRGSRGGGGGRGAPPPPPPHTHSLTHPPSRTRPYPHAFL
jgi:hypothetical protein